MHSRLRAALSLVPFLVPCACKHKTPSVPSPEATPAMPASPIPSAEAELPCDEPVGQTRSYLVPSWEKSTERLATRPEQETVIERAMIGDYCVERLEITSKGRPTVHVLRATDGKHVWRLAQLRSPLGRTTVAALERAIDELRPTDMFFTRGQKWTYTYARAFHAIPENFSGQSPKSVPVEVAKVAVVGDTEYAYLRHRTDLPQNWLWARRGTKLWLVAQSDEPDFSFTSTPGSFYWLRHLDAPAHIDTRNVKTEVVCTATVCLPAWHYRSQYMDFDLLPFVGTLRVVERSYEEDTGDGGTFHFFLQEASPRVNGQKMSPTSFVPRPESEALQNTRRRVVQALEAPTLLDALRLFASKNFHLTPFDEVYASWTDIAQEWSESHVACTKRMLLDILKQPCWELGSEVAVCTEPHLEKDSLTPSALLATRASATFRREGGKWRLLNYLDPLALYEEGNLPPCPAKDF